MLVRAYRRRLARDGLRRDAGACASARADRVRYRSKAASDSPEKTTRVARGVGFTCCPSPALERISVVTGFNRAGILLNRKSPRIELCNSHEGRGLGMSAEVAQLKRENIELVRSAILALPGLARSPGLTSRQVLIELRKIPHLDLGPHSRHAFNAITSLKKSRTVVMNGYWLRLGDGAATA